MHTTTLLFRKLTLPFVNFLFLFTAPHMYAQEIHDPAELLKILEASELTYVIEMEEVNVNESATYNRLNTNQYYQDISGESIELLEYQISAQDSVTLSQAEEHFAAESYDSARYYYQKVITRSPHIAFPKVYTGQSYGIEKNWDEAIKWYREAIKTNYIDYMAHWFLADALVEKGKIKEAQKEISVAFVLNRNNPRIRKAFDNIYMLNNSKYESWEFTPKYRVSRESGKGGDGDINLKANADWLMYSIAKAIWEYEPGYREKMTGSSEFTFNSAEEREALLGILIGNMKKSGKWKKSKSEPAFNYLYKAVSNDHLTNFIMVDIWFRNYPVLAYTQSQESIEQLAEYVQFLRGSAK